MGRLMAIFALAIMLVLLQVGNPVLLTIAGVALVYWFGGGGRGGRRRRRRRNDQFLPERDPNKAIGGKYNIDPPFAREADA